MTELLWIAVPAGALAPDGRARCAVVVVPRLSGGGTTLAGHGMEDWPALLRAATITLSVRAEGHVVDPGPQVSVDWGFTEAQMRRHWRAMFLAPRRLPEECASWVEVQEYQEPPDRALEIVPTSEEAGALRTLYGKEVAGAPVDEQLAQAWTAGRRRRASRARQSGGVAEGTPERCPPDFHGAVGLLREHPYVLRALGLIIDVDVELPSGTEAVQVSVTLPAWPAGPTPTHTTFWTRCGVRDGRFLAEPTRDGALVDGMVGLKGTGIVEPQHDTSRESGAVSGVAAPVRRWSVVTFDVDAAMLRLPAVTDARTGGAGPALPGLRSAGLALVRAGRQAELVSRIGRAAQRTKRAEREADGLYADDLVLGYRLDVGVEAPAEIWRSLCRRRTAYAIDGVSLGPAQGILEEGHVKPDAMTAYGGPGSTLEGDEVVARWDGWSLAVPRPALGGERTRPRSASALEWSMSVAPPLPRLRFGSHYRLRARVADIGGGGLTVEDLGGASTEQITGSIFYGRVEPIPAPLLMATEPPGPGGGLERVVVRSAGGPARKAGTFPATTRCLLSPPPISVELADQHGLFDRYDDDPQRSWELASRAMRGIDAVANLAPSAGEPVPWLTDPLAHQWVLVGSGRELHAPWAGRPGDSPSPSETWVEDPVPLVLDVQRAADTALTLAGGRVLMSLAPADQVELQVSSRPHASDIDQLALHHWVESQPGPDSDAHHFTFEEVLAAVGDGHHPHITPARTLQIVHAVQRPMLAPAASLHVDRSEGAVFATLTAPEGIAFDQASTVQLDLTAAWQEWGDAPVPLGSKSAIIASQAVPAADAPAAPFAPQRHEFGDTRRRRVTYTLTAVSRFQDCFDPALAKVDPTAFATTGAPILVDVPSSARPPEPVVVSVVPAWRFREEPSTPTPGLWERVRGSSKLRVHLAPGWYASGEDEQLAVVVLPDENVSPLRSTWPFLSQAGRDPIRDTDEPKRWLVWDEVGGDDAEAWLEEAGDVVSLQTFRPWHDPSAGSRGPWIVDLDLPDVADSSYCTFVQLALARYQPSSVGRLHLSPVVRTEMTQLFPSRYLTIRLGSDKALVRVEGSGPDGTPNIIETWVERWSGAPGNVAAHAAGELATTGDSGIASWVRMSGFAASGSLGDELSVPVPTFGDEERRRLVVQESESVESPPGEQGLVAKQLGRRVVFYETMPLVPQP